MFRLQVMVSCFAFNHIWNGAVLPSSINKFLLEQATNAQRGSRGMALLFL